MTHQTVDLAAAVAAADLALAAPAEQPAAGVLEAHACQTGCGRLANVVMVRLADSDLDILCDICWVTMALAIVSEIPDPGSVDTGVEGG